MLAYALDEPPPVVADRPARFTGLLLGRHVTVTGGCELPIEALAHLLGQLHEQWDVRRRRSDLGRLSDRPAVVMAVSPLTQLLARHVQSALLMLQQAQVFSPRDLPLIDSRHGRVGLDATAAALAGRLAPAVAVDVLVDFCVRSGAAEGRAQVGDLVRRFDDRTPAWLAQVAEDTQRLTSMSHAPARGQTAVAA